MLLIFEGPEPSTGLQLDSPKLSVLREGLPPVLAARLLRMLDDRRLMDAMRSGGSQASAGAPDRPRTLLREIQGRYPEVLSALRARTRAGPTQDD